MYLRTTAHRVSSVLCGTLVLTACSARSGLPEAGDLVNLTVTTTGSGTVVSAPAGIYCGHACEAPFVVGDAVALTAVPSFGATFVGWSGSCSGADLVCSFTVSDTTSVAAEFTYQAAIPDDVVRLDVAITGSGVVYSIPSGIYCGAECAADFERGHQVLLVAVPATTATFLGWAGGCASTGTATSCDLGLDLPTSVTAAFSQTGVVQPDVRTLTVTPAVGGTISSQPAGIYCGQACAADFLRDATVTLTASPDPGAAFAGWSGACSGALATCDVSITADATVGAAFNYLLEVDVSGTGTGTVASAPAGITCTSGSCVLGFAPSTQVTLTATPGGGSYFGGWGGACTGGLPCTVALDQARAVSAKFYLGGTAWSRTAGSDRPDWVSYVVVTADGSIVISGATGGDIDFGGGTLWNSGNDDAFVAKYGPDGTYRWAKIFGSSQYDYGDAVAVDSVGDVILVGNYGAATDFGGGNFANAGSQDVFIVKLRSSDGGYLWSKHYGGASWEGTSGVAVDSSNNVIVSGVFNGTVDFGGGGPGTLVSQGYQDAFVAKYQGSNGAHLWSKSGGGGQADEAWALALDPSGNALVTGYTTSVPANFGGADLAPLGEDEDVWVAKYAGSNGAHLWSKRLGGWDWEVADGIATDPSGNVFITGTFDRTATFGVNTEDIFITKLAAANGAVAWTRSFGGAADESAYSIAVDYHGDLIVAGVYGHLAGDVGDLGFGPVVSQGGMDIFLARYSAVDGAPLAFRTFASAQDDEAGASVGPSGQVALVGKFAERIDLGGTFYDPVGYSDAFIFVMQGF